MQQASDSKARTIISLKAFDWDAKERTLTTEASTLGSPFSPDAISKACAPPLFLHVESHHTGKITDWKYARRLLHEGQIIGWVYRPTDRFSKHGNISAVVFWD